MTCCSFVSYSSFNVKTKRFQSTDCRHCSSTFGGGCSGFKLHVIQLLQLDSEMPLNPENMRCIWNYPWVFVSAKTILKEHAS